MVWKGERKMTRPGIEAIKSNVIKTIEIKAPNFRAYSPNYVRKKLGTFLNKVAEATSSLKKGEQIKISDFCTINNLDIFRVGLAKKLIKIHNEYVLCDCYERKSDEANLIYTIKGQYNDD